MAITRITNKNPQTGQDFLKVLDFRLKYRLRANSVLENPSTNGGYMVGEQLIPGRRAMAPPKEPATLTDERFVQLLTQNQLRLRTYIFTLVRDSSHADDILQEASIALWKKRESFDTSRDFFRWACGIALIEVLRHRRKAAADRLQFDEALVNLLAEEYIEHAEESDRRRAALPDCLNKLSEQDRWLVSARYSSGITVKQIAEQLGRPLSTVYSSLARIRESLYRCVEHSIALESHPVANHKGSK